MKKIAIAAFMALIQLCSSVNAQVGENYNINAQLALLNCTAANANCPQTLTMGGKVGAAAVAVNYNSFQKVNVGTISAETTKIVAFPATAGQGITYTFTPTQGALAGQAINLEIYRIPTPAGTPGAGQYKFELTRSVAGLPRIRAAIIQGGASAPGALGWNFTFEPDGTVHVKDYKGQTTADLDLGETNPAQSSAAAAA